MENLPIDILGLIYSYNTRPIYKPNPAIRLSIEDSKYLAKNPRAIGWICKNFKKIDKTKIFVEPIKSDIVQAFSMENIKLFVKYNPGELLQLEYDSMDLTDLVIMEELIDKFSSFSLSKKQIIQIFHNPTSGLLLEKLNEIFDGRLFRKTAEFSWDLEINLFQCLFMHPVASRLAFEYFISSGPYSIDLIIEYVKSNTKKVNWGMVVESSNEWALQLYINTSAHINLTHAGKLRFFYNPAKPVVDWIIQHVQSLDEKALNQFMGEYYLYVNPSDSVINFILENCRLIESSNICPLIFLATLNTNPRAFSVFVQIVQKISHGIFLKLLAVPNTNVIAHHYWKYHGLFEPVSNKKIIGKLIGKLIGRI